MNLKFSAVVGVLALTASANAASVQLFNNSGFETGSLSGWTVASTAGSDDAFFADNTTITPLNGDATVGPFAGNWYAVSDQSGLVTPETTTLYQSVTIPVGSTSDILSVEWFVNDQFGTSGLGGEVAIWAAGANTLTATPLFVVLGPRDTAVVGGVPNPYVLGSRDITADVTAGTTYEIGVLERDSTGYINVGVDNFTLTATTGTVTTPEPGMLIPIGVMAAGMLVYRARRKARA